MALVASLVASAASTVFAWRLGRAWVAGGRRNPALLAWTISLWLFAVASVMLVWGESIGWGSVNFHLFYLFGAVLTVPWLALGSTLINARDRVTSRVTGAAALLTGLAFAGSALQGDLLAMPGLVVGLTWGALLWLGDRDRLRVGASVLALAFTSTAAAVVLASGLVDAIPAQGLPEGRELFGPAARGFAVGGNAVGSIVVIVGALVAVARLGWGASPVDVREQAGATLRRLRLSEALAQGVRGGWRALAPAGLRDLAVGNLLIALGTVIAAGLGGMFSFLGDTTAHAVGLGLGVVVMYAGFARTARPIGRSA